ncbi:MAG: hypothetical protein U0325_34065 [Polyangiales bacterium]
MRPPGARRQVAAWLISDDGVACTRDTCLVDGTCRNAPQDSECPSGQTCRATGCGTGTTTPGTCRMASDCDDRLECTEDTCNAAGQCINVAQNARCGAGRVCRAGMGCVAERSCSSDRDCDDGLRCNGAAAPSLASLRRRYTRELRRRHGLHHRHVRRGRRGDVRARDGPVVHEHGGALSAAS